MNFTVFRAFDTVASTQDIARELLLTGEPPGIVVSAQFQTGGRGRRGKTWFAPHGANVMLTAVGLPVPADAAWQIALVAGVAVAEGIREAIPAVRPVVRFPNDVYLNSKKLSGILIETVPHPKAGFVTPLIGIGVNGNSAEADFPPDLRETATSLLRETGQEISKPDLQERILLRLGALWEAWQHEPLGEAIIPRWNALADPEARRTFLIDGQPLSCRVIGLDSEGNAVLELPTGQQKTLPAVQVILGDG